MAMLAAPLDYWQKLRSEDAAGYKKQKQRLADAVAEAADQRIPGFREAIEVTDVATPATYVRVANLYKASFEGFAPTPALIKTQIRKRIPGVKRLLLCGQWTTAGGGICTAVASGKAAAEQIQKELKR
jgi:phytoene dehydrogenase-like protein